MTNTEEKFTETELQNVATKIVHQNVYYCVSYLMMEVGKLNIYESEWSEEFTESVSYQLLACGCDMDEEEKAEAEENGDELESCGSCEREVYEHWIVSPYLRDQLRELGETVTDFMSMDVWSRCTTGQSIALDWPLVLMAKERIRERRKWDKESEENIKKLNKEQQARDLAMRNDDGLATFLVKEFFGWVPRLLKSAASFTRTIPSAFGL